MKARWQFAYWLGAAGLVAVIALLYRLSSHLDHTNLLRVEVAVEELQSIEVATNLDVLKLKQRKKSDYDELATAGERVDRVLDRLRPEFDALGQGATLLPLRQAWASKAGDLERFKQYNAVLRNSHHHFVNLAHELGGQGGSRQMDDFIRRLLVFLASESRDDLPDFSESLAALGREVENWPAGQREKGRLLLGHGSTVLSHHLLVSRLSDQILDSPFPGAVDNAYAAYRLAFARAGEVADSYRSAMAAITVLLIAIVLFVTLRLRESSRQLARSHRLLDNITDTLGEGIVAFDADGGLTFVNRAGQALLGGPTGDLVGKPMREVLFRGAEDAASQPLLAAAAAAQPFNGEAWLPTAGGPTPAAFIGSPLAFGGDGRSGGYVFSIRDLSEVRNAQARLHLASHVFDSLSEAMVITDAEGRIQSVNPAFTAITGYSEEEARGQRPGGLLGSGLHDGAFFRDMWQALATRGKWQAELTNRRKNGELYTEWLSISAVRDASGATIQYIGLFTDITERKETEAHIHHLAYHDSLTGLANRALFSDRLDTSLHQAHRERRQLAVLMFDLDRFKLVNDTLGHHSGDRLLQEVAERIGRNIREGDTLARLGGDEFALLMPEVRSAADAANLACKLLEVLAQPVQLEGREVYSTTSIGISLYPAHGTSGGQLLKNADVALYAAKNCGRNTFRFFDPEEMGASDRLELEMALRHALARQQLSLHYQLQFDTRKGTVSGAEALIRWQHPDLGLVSPERFIPLAEESGIIVEIGLWCLETACRQWVAWQAEGLAVPRIAINVSAHQLRYTDFAGQLLEIIHRTGIQPRHLELELTESTLTHDTESVFTLFSELRRQGIRIAIDDFGTGYSSLNYLAEYPVDVIKVDRSFVSRIDNDEEAPYVVRAVVQLAHGLRMETVAEGVETEEQRRLLDEMGCDHLQGFLLAAPCPPEEIPALVREFTPAGKACLSQ